MLPRLDLELQNLQEGKILGDGPDTAVEGAKHLQKGDTEVRRNERVSLKVS